MSNEGELGDVATWVGSAMGALAFFWAIYRQWRESRPKAPHVTVMFEKGKFAPQERSTVWRCNAEIWAVDDRNPTVLERIELSPKMVIASTGRGLGGEVYQPLPGKQVLPGKDGILSGNWRLKPYNPVAPVPATVPFSFVSPVVAMPSTVRIAFHFGRRGPNGFAGTVRVVRRLDPMSDDEQ